MDTSVPSAVVVARSFGTYNKGDLITEPATVRAILGGGNAMHVVVPVLPGRGGSMESEQH